MNVSTHYKICPRCKTSTALTAAKCDTCGREFKTTFAANTPPDDKTDFGQYPGGSSPRLKPEPGKRVPPPPQTHSRWGEARVHASVNGVSEPPLDPSATAAAASPHALAFGEYVRQYNSLNVWHFLGIFFSLGLFGIAMLVYAIIQKQALRRRVAEMGTPPDMLFASLDKALGRWVGGVILTVVAAFVLVFVIDSIIERAGSTGQRGKEAEPPAYSAPGPTDLEAPGTDETGFRLRGDSLSSPRLAPLPAPPPPQPTPGSI